MLNKLRKFVQVFFKTDVPLLNTKEMEYLEIRKKVVESIAAGKIDTNGNSITKVFVTGDEYSVYEIKTDILSESLRTSLYPFTQTDVNEIEKRFDGIRIKYSQVKGQLYKASDDTSIKAQIAHIISRALNGHVQEANKSFDALIENINAEYRAQLSHRTTYLLTTISIVITFILFCIYIHQGNILANQVLIKTLIFVSTAACVGGFVSVSRKIKNAVFEKDVSSLIFVLYGVERMFISVIAGVVSYAAIRCKLLFGVVTELESPICGFMIFAVVAGFSETLIPGLLSKLEQDNK